MKPEQPEYSPTAVEAAIQSKWQAAKNGAGRFAVPDSSDQDKFYALAMLPYPSGDLHMGHVRNYTLSDVVARLQWANGKQVLQPMGWDSFGLPAENAAIKNKLPPAEWTKQNIQRMRGQLQAIGLAIDWNREISTCEPSYYRWEQWLFIELFKKGLVYKKNALVNWDPIDQTVLANEQVVDGRGWRSGAIVEKKEIPQWFIKITDYADELLSGLDELKGWPEQVKTMQRNWIGKSTGAEVRFSGLDCADVTVFTSRIETIYGASFIAISPNHPLATKQAATDTKLKKFIEQCAQTSTAEADVAKQEKLGYKLQFQATNPATNVATDIWVANYVLDNAGTGAIMGVPAHDSRDHEFATKYKIAITPVIKDNNTPDWDFSAKAYTGKGEIITGPLQGLDSNSAKEKVLSDLVAKNVAPRQ